MQTCYLEGGLFRNMSKEGMWERRNRQYLMVLRLNFLSKKTLGLGNCNAYEATGLAIAVHTVSVLCHNIKSHIISGQLWTLPILLGINLVVKERGGHIDSGISSRWWTWTQLWIQTSGQTLLAALLPRNISSGLTAFARILWWMVKSESMPKEWVLGLPCFSPLCVQVLISKIHCRDWELPGEMVNYEFISVHA